MIPPSSFTTISTLGNATRDGICILCVKQTISNLKMIDRMATNKCHRIRQAKWQNVCMYVHFDQMCLNKKKIRARFINL